ncbi:MAG: hypothetical protein ACRD6U_01425 [Nitrososphaeraceae archaeon]
MSDKKIRIFSTFLLLGIAAIFFPATALQNSIAMAQEFYPEYEENQYYSNQEGYDPYKNNNDNYKNGPIVNVEKKLFVCNNGTQNPIDFFCSSGPEDFFLIPEAIDSGEYIPCNDEICPFIDESDFSAQIFKDVATVRDLTPEGTPVNLDKFHYSITERDIEDLITTDSFCKAVGFSHSNFSVKITDNNVIFYDMCVNYVGDCEGTIYLGEEKTCTIENYIYSGFSEPIPTDGNTAGAAQSSSLLSQQSNNPMMHSQLNILKDIISHRTR